MRYEDWDILLFPRDGKVPLKEFKVACHVVHDNELSHIHGSVGLPTVCCFVPSLLPGAPYKLSIHSWSTPPISQFTRSYGKFADRVVFEVRLFVDGRLVSSFAMNRSGPWPNVLKNSFDLSDTGEVESLMFPNFQRELLNQSYWSPADDLGRIKVVISESYPRESLSVPFERLKNIVAFSFQHAPLEILEISAIAWPNSSMWRGMPFSASTTLPDKQLGSSRSHAHSPRPRNNFTMHANVSLAGGAIAGTGPFQAAKYKEVSKPPTFSYSDALLSTNTPASDPFVEANAYFEWLSGIGMGLNGETNSTPGLQAATHDHHKSSTDTSMPDYVSSTGLPSNTDGGTDSYAVRMSNEGDSKHLKVPTNTPTTCDPITESEDIHFSMLPSHTPVSTCDSMNTSFLSNAATLSPQLLPTPAMDVKSRKENNAKQLTTPPPPVSATISISGEPTSVRRISQQLFESGSLVMTAGSECESPSRRMIAGRSGKRIRDFSSTSSENLENEEVLRRASPHVRLGALDKIAAK